MEYFVDIASNYVQSVQIANDFSISLYGTWYPNWVKTENHEHSLCLIVVSITEININF